MTPYVLSARLLAPLLIQTNRQSHAPESLGYVPGSTLRGALAGMYLRCLGQADDEAFRLLFGPEGPNFPDLLPSTGPDVLSECLPLTTLSCKRFPGFLKKSDQGQKHGVRDRLVLLAANRFGMDGSDQTHESFRKCPHCKHDLKLFTGIWNNQPDNPVVIELVRLLQRHTGIDRSTGTVASKVFYAPQVIREVDSSGNPLYLTGRIWLNRAQFQVLQEMIEQETVFVGGDRARGRGEVALELIERPEMPVDVQAWSNAWTERYRGVVNSPPPSGIYFSIRLASPAVLVDRFLRPTWDLDLPIPGVKLVGKSVQWTVVRGWQAAWGLPKPNDAALDRGSVFLYQYIGNDPEALNLALDRLLKTGVGLRRQEGFGDIRVCEPLHVREEL